MKQSFLIIAAFLILLESCASLNSSKKIKIFEQTLGIENSKALSDYVNAFENEVLKTKYPSVATDIAYTRLLAEDPGSIVPMKLHTLFVDYNLESYFKSQLWHEIYAPVDSIWFEDFELRVRYVYLSEEGKKTVSEGGYSYNRSLDKDSLAQSELRVCSFNHLGKYFQAFESSKKGIPFLEDLYSTKYAVGEISIALFAKMVERHKLDLNGYLVRRIVAVELGKFINDAREPKKSKLVNNGYDN